MTEGNTAEGGRPATRRIGLRLRIAERARRLDKKRLAFILLGVGLFCLVFFASPFRDAVDPQGKRFPLTAEGQACLALFLLVLTWWITEVIPIGVTAIAIGVVQALLLIRKPKTAFGDFMDPSVWFIFGSMVIGLAFTRTGLTRRLAYGMLALVGERTSLIYLGTFTVAVGLTLVMAHTAVAATLFPILMTIHALYTDDTRPTRFGKGLFIGMAFAAGCGSIITFLGAARTAVAAGFFRDIVGREVPFFQVPYYMLPLALLMTFLVWILISIVYRPERSRIEGLRERVSTLYSRLGPVTPVEWGTLFIVGGAVLVLAVTALVPAMKGVNKSGVILAATVLFFLFKILTIKDLEDIPWNIILLFGGSMSLGSCLWETGAASWMAIQWLGLLQGAHWFVFIMGITLFVLAMTNVIMNVAAIAITLPVALVLAPYMGVAPDVILYASLTAAGMPFMLLIGAAPNAIAYESKQFSSAEFLRTGALASLLLLIVTALFVSVVWPLQGLPTLVR